MVTLSLKTSGKEKRPSQASTSSRQSLVLGRSSFVTSEKDLITVDDDGTRKFNPNSDKISNINCMFMLFSGAMGAGILSLPTVLQKNGFLVGSLLLCVGGVFSAVSEYYLMKCTRIANEENHKNNLPPVSSYSSLLEFAAKKAWPGAPTAWVSTVLNIVFVVYLWAGVIVALTQSLFTFVDRIFDGAELDTVKDFLLEEDIAGKKQMTWPALALLVAAWFPLCVPKDMGSLKVVSKYPFIAIMSTVLFVLYAWCSIDSERQKGLDFKNWTGTKTSSAEDKSVPILFSAPNHILAILALSGRFVFAYMTHTNVVTCAFALEDKTDAAALKISSWNVSAIALFYILISFSVVAVAGETNTISFTGNEIYKDPSVKTWNKVICIMLSFVVLAAIPLNFPPLRQAFFDIYVQFFGASKPLIEENDIDDSSSDEENLSWEARQLLPKEGKTSVVPEMSFTARAVITTLMLTSGVILAKLRPGIDDVLDCLAPLGVLVMIGFPAFMMQNILNSENSKRGNVWSKAMYLYALFGFVGFIVANSWKFFGKGQNSIVDTLRKIVKNEL